MGKVAMDKTRLTANPCVSVADLYKIFENWITMSLSKDLHSLLEPPDKKPFSWKTTPNHKWLAKVAPLYSLLVKLVPNTVLTSKKLVMVLQSLKANELVTNNTKMDDQLFYDWCDQTIRILFAKFREVKQRAEIFDRVQKKCTHEEWKAIDEVLVRMDIGADEPGQDEGKKQSTLAPPMSWTSWQTSFESTASSEGLSLSKTTPSVDAPKEYNIFRKILDGCMESEAPTAVEALSTNSSQELQPLATIVDTKCKLIDGSPETDCSSEDSFTEHQQQAINTALVSKPQLLKAPRKQKQSCEVQKVAAKPAASKPKTTTAKHKSTEKQRVTSAAYHKAYTEALRANGGNVSLAKEAAREAYKDAASKYV